MTNEASNHAVIILKPAEAASIRRAIQALQSAAVPFVMVDPSAPLDPALLEPLAPLLAAAESARKTNRSAAQAESRRKRIEQGRIPAGQVPYGYHVVTRAEVLAGRRPQSEIGVVEIDEYQAGIVRMIFSQYLRYRSTSEVARNLETKRAATPSARGAWSASTVARILLNPAYVGRMEWGSGPARGVIACPPIVDELSFESARVLLQNNSRRTFRDNADRRIQRTLLANIARCAACGSPIVSGSYEPSKRLERVGGLYYACRVCPPQPWNANSPRPQWCLYKPSMLDRAVFAALLPLLPPDDAEIIHTCVFLGDWNAPMALRRRLLRQCGFTPYVDPATFAVTIGCQDIRNPTETQRAMMVHLLTTGARALAEESQFNWEFNPKSRPS